MQVFLHTVSFVIFRRRSPPEKYLRNAKGVTFRRVLEIGGFKLRTIPWQQTRRCACQISSLVSIDALRTKFVKIKSIFGFDESWFVLQVSEQHMLSGYQNSYAENRQPIMPSGCKCPRAGKPAADRGSYGRYRGTPVSTWNRQPDRA